jgi:hypothetical protein
MFQSLIFELLKNQISRFLFNLIFFLLLFMQNSIHSLFDFKQDKFSMLQILEKLLENKPDYE